MTVPLEQYIPTDDRDATFSIGELEVRLIGEGTNVRMHLDGRALTGMPERGGWRDVTIPPGHTIRIVPRTPDLPVVLRSDELIELAVDAGVQFNLFIPMWIEFLHEGKKDRKPVEGSLEDVPTVALKRSWFGTPESGEVSYSWRFTPGGRRSHQRHFLTVPVTIVNRSSTVLRFERFLLRAIHLSVYELQGRLVTNAVTVAFKGSEQMSQITFENDASMEKKGGRLKSGPRERSNGDIIRKSFSWLWELAG